MDSEMTAVLVASMISLILIIMYAAASVRERGQAPFWAKEVYFYAPAPAPADLRRVLTTFDARLATAPQVKIYLAAGGEPHGVGLVTADGVGLVTADGVGLVTADGFHAAGLWLYGAKPPRNEPNVARFSRLQWFQPAP